MDINKARTILINENLPIAKRMRALFFLRNTHTNESAKAIAEGFSSKSVLLKHELAYVLGQMRMDISLDTLIKVLSNENENEIVRHEAGEALGNYPMSEKIVNTLEKYVNHDIKPISETCYLALKKIKLNKDGISKFGSRDPAYPFIGSFDEAKKVILDENEDLYKRYEAMFFLRDLGTEEAIKTLGESMKDKSALFKHEVSFVFGQMKKKQAMPYLVKAMSDESEHGMVRHECAEALGSLGDENSYNALVPFLHDKCDILRESVEVAVDIYNHINSDELEYCEVA